MNKLASLLLLSALMVPLAAVPAKADPGGWNGHRNGREYRPHERARWVHARHGGRYGWWWVSGNAWRYYPYYPTAAYAYPVVAPPVVAAPPPAPTLVLSFGGHR
jgi:hypothetical protein